MSGQKPNTAEISITRVAELFLEERRNGDTPRIEGYLRAFPHLAEEIQELFPTLELLDVTFTKREVKKDDRIAGCLIENEIGRGAMGVVYRAKHETSKRIVAIKVIPLNPVVENDRWQRFEMERIALARLDHPHIVPVISHGNNKQYAYLVLQLIDGLNIAQLLKGEGDFKLKYFLEDMVTNWCSLAKMAINVAGGLQHAHDQGMVHRDIKPANLLLDRAGKVWISDFGLAKVWDVTNSLSQTGDIIGTPLYMAPEQSKGVCDARSDVYSLGLTLYEIACGKKAWARQAATKPTERRLPTSLPDLATVNPDVPPELAKIIMRACEFSPADRYQSANELKVVLQRFLAGATPSDRRTKPRLPDRLYRQMLAQHRRKTITLGGACALSAFAFSLYFLTRAAPEPAPAPTPITVTPASVDNTIAGVSLVDRLAASEDEQVVDIVADIFRESVQTQSSDKYAQEAKQNLLNRIDRISDRFKNKELGTKDLDQFLKEYRKTSLATATRLMHITPVLINSRLRPQEKQWAFQLLQSFGLAIVNRGVEQDDAKNFINGLIRNRFNSIEEGAKVRIPDAELRSWFGQLHTWMSKMPPQAFQRHGDIPPELDDLLNRNFGQ